MSADADSHSDLMDDVYRHQRRIYDATRKYYLLGRDHLIQQLKPAQDAHILEVACGTGRNLDKIAWHYPGRALYGLDISNEMLISARAKLGERAQLAQGDACDFDPSELFRRRSFDHIVLSYSLSMIPDWQAALAEAILHLKPGGTLHIVDFGDQSGLPLWFKGALRNWLQRFHVSPRDNLNTVLGDLATQNGAKMNYLSLYRGYAQYAQLRR